MATTAEKLDVLYDYKIGLDLIEGEKQKLRETVISQEDKDKITELMDEIAHIQSKYQEKYNEIEIEFEGKEEALNNNINLLDKEIRAETKAAGETIRSKSGDYMAVYRKGTTKWESEKLEGYAIDHPEILAWRTVSEPSIAIQKTPGK